jgi:hypothetical protein
MRRAIQRQEFHATLPAKLDAEVERVAEIIDFQLERHKRRPVYSEDLEGDTPLGGPMQSSYNFDDDDPDPAA